ncbi:juvenile hormone epoxide hydrolase-like [Zerene cesonia]|uniref:juvenile hormone epoxide hydrolase-like n=1 Tax=Zerene cesonia TaxID=33412 RepID=UPI0018E58A49|nr:juvenile hormone epoxide hydrolase-like [Zerene cesonia]
MFKTLAFYIALVAVGAGVGFKYYLEAVPDLPELDYQRWWGDGQKPQKDDESIRPFKVTFNDSMIDDLKQRLIKRRPFRQSLEGTQSLYGMNTLYLEKIIKYWLEEYNFKERADRLNRFPHFKTRIQGLDIHYMHVKPEAKDKKVLPLLMLHGWPSSSKEFDIVIPMLTKPVEGYDFVFEVIAADLPGFGFSQGTNKRGLSPLQIAIIMRNLMKRVGFKQYYIQAGDWGSQVATHMTTVFPNDILGFHTNMPLSSRPISDVKFFLGSFFPSLFMEQKYISRIYPLKKFFDYVVRESGYLHLQATKPDSVGVALTDSPAGLAAYTLEKIAVCSNRDQLDTPHGGLENIALDDLLDTVTILWANDCIVTSMRIYMEAFASDDVFVVHNIPTPVPTAAIKFKYEVVYQPDWILRDKFLNLVRSTTLDFGGHFAALHTPKDLADDVFAAVNDIIKFHKNASSNNSNPTK